MAKRAVRRRNFEDEPVLLGIDISSAARNERVYNKLENDSFG
jgi:hypothetical protein